MKLSLEQTLFLRDHLERTLGQITVHRIFGDLVFGDFTPAADYLAVEKLFADYVEAANEQLLSVVGDLDEEISALGLRLVSLEEVELPAIHDVQIGAGVITFRVKETHEPNLQQTKNGVAEIVSSPNRVHRP